MAKASKNKAGAKKGQGAGVRLPVRRQAAKSAAKKNGASGHTNPAELLTPTMRARELFWFNVVREILMSLWSASQKPSTWKVESSGASSTPAPNDAAADLLDGRFSVVTNTGLRVPIAQVQPVFGCGVLGKENREHWLSQAVECTVFQIRTPQGEVFTLPVHAVRAFHSLSEESMDQLGKSARGNNDEGPEAPFGFAAYTSLARSAGAASNAADIDPRWIDASE